MDNKPIITMPLRIEHFPRELYRTLSNTGARLNRKRFQTENPL